MKRNQIAIIVGGIGVAIILTLIFTSFEETVEQTEEVFKETVDEQMSQLAREQIESGYKPLETIWNESGPFKINQSEYSIGNKIFMVVNGLEFNEKGEIVILRPLNSTHHQVWENIPFDGAEKSSFNTFLVPKPSLAKEICTVDELVGKWIIDFKGVDYDHLEFEMIETIVPGTNRIPAC